MSILRVLWRILIILIIPILVLSMINDVRIIHAKICYIEEYRSADSYVQAPAFVLSNLFFKAVMSFTILLVLDVLGF